jgi:O-glycosyl hydrolase
MSNTTMFRVLFLLVATLGSFSIASTEIQKAQISVDATIQFQTVDGFGISESFQRAGQIFGKMGLSVANRYKIVDLLFNNEVGAGLTLLRNGIGSSNSSDKDFMNSIMPFSPGSPSVTPTYRWDYNDSSQVWLAQQASFYGVRIIADAWSAPSFMKTNLDDAHGGYLCGVSGTACPSGDWKKAYAKYIAQYILYYQASHITISHVGFLNEPEKTEFYASMLSNGTQAADFIKVFEPTLRAAGLDTKIICCDGAGWNYQASMLKGIQDAGAETLLDVVTSHGYSDPPAKPFDTSLPVWQSEWADLKTNWTNAWFESGAPGEGMTWATAIQDAFVKSNVSAFFYWQGAETTPWNSALIRLDGDTYSVSKRLWAFAQFSRFVKPGAVRIEAKSDDGKIGVSAFRNANAGVAVQVINNTTAEYEIEVKVDNGTALNGMSAYLTNTGNDLTVMDPLTAVGNTGNAFEVTVPARSMVSFVGI